MHQPALIRQDIDPDSVLDVLRNHVGRANGVTAEELALEISGEARAIDLRHLRAAVEQLRRDGHAVCAEPTHGYYLACNATDIDRCCRFLYARAMTSLTQIAAMKRVALPPLAGQLGINLETDHD